MTQYIHSLNRKSSDKINTFASWHTFLWIRILILIFRNHVDPCYIRLKLWQSFTFAPVIHNFNPTNSVYRVMANGDGLKPIEQIHRHRRKQRSAACWSLLLNRTSSVVFVAMTTTNGKRLTESVNLCALKLYNFQQYPRQT